MLVLEGALAAVARDGNIKFYGGEPTLHSDGLLQAMRYLRARGFQGLFTIYSNGVKARTLIHLLESDPQSEAVLNYSIYLGRDADPLPAHAKELLEAWSRANPLWLFSGYKVLYHAGAGTDMVLTTTGSPPTTCSRAASCVFRCSRRVVSTTFLCTVLECGAPLWSTFTGSGAPHSWDC
jgi:hypothetical protein